MNENIQVDEAQIGRILHYVIDKGYKLQCRPAIVVEDWPDQGKPGYVNLQLFLDGTNDASYKTGWETSVLPNHAVRANRTWHWPRECPGLGNPPPAYTSGSDIKYHHNHTDAVIDVANCVACKVSTEEIQAPVKVVNSSNES